MIDYVPLRRGGHLLANVQLVLMETASSNSCWEVSGSITDVLAMLVDGALLGQTTYREQLSQHLSTRTTEEQTYLGHNLVPSDAGLQIRRHKDYDILLLGVSFSCHCRHRFIAS
jgi:hypothetical protein